MSLHHFFGWPEDREFVEKNVIWGILKHKQQVIAYCQIQYDHGPLKNAFKVGNVKFTNMYHLPLWRKYVSEVKAAKGLGDTGQKSREFTSPPESPNRLSCCLIREGNHFGLFWNFLQSVSVYTEFVCDMLLFVYCVGTGYLMQFPPHIPHTSFYIYIYFLYIF